MEPPQESGAREFVQAPGGERFEVVGRAGPIDFEPAPYIPAEAGEELLVVKEGELFACSRPDGDIRPGPSSGEGLYANDTRYLSELSLTLGEGEPVLLSSSAEVGYEAVVDLTNTSIPQPAGTNIPQMTLNVRRTRLVNERMYERVVVRNHGRETIDSSLELSFAADFADMFEVRGIRLRDTRGQALAPKAAADSIRFAYVGEDGAFRETLVELQPSAAHTEIAGTRVRARWPVKLAPSETLDIYVTVTPSLEGSVARISGYGPAEASAREQLATWEASCTRISTAQTSFNRYIRASLRDLKALFVPFEGMDVVTAGIPWYVCPFGRDSLLTCYEMLMLNPDKARDTLLYLARYQATGDDPTRDAEPGKILHEFRSGELARAGYIAHTPYYGTVDATPLFLMLAASYFRWTADLETMEQLRPHLDAALSWIDEHGDADGDGFVEYLRRAPGGLENQGWKDSDDCVVHADGSLAEGSIALVEVQGYVYLAKLRVSEVYAALGAPDIAASLKQQADELRTRFNDAYWMPDEGTFALALDGSKNQVKGVTSNPGHCLYCGIVDDDKAQAVADRLMAPDMFSGWGIRTLSADSPAYNPMSYHNGSVWPHDNAIVASGLKRYDRQNDAAEIVRVLFEAALETRESRLPELYCGFRRRAGLPFVRYPVACRPQAWAAAAPFMLLQAMLGISARAPEKVLTINQPYLPEWLTAIELSNMRVGDARVSLGFTRAGDSTSFSLLQRHGDIRVTIQA